MARCFRCGAKFKISEAKEEFKQHLYEMGWDNYINDKMDDFDSEYCADCNIEDFDEREGSTIGTYRSYDEYLASGGPVDPCDDALWLHDQE